MTPTQIIRPQGIPSSETFGTPTIVQTRSMAVATIAQADAALQHRMSREGYILGYAGAGAAAGELVGGAAGFIVGGAAGGAFAYYRSRSPRG
jgi:hypothetical protein